MAPSPVAHPCAGPDSRTAHGKGQQLLTNGFLQSLSFWLTRMWTEKLRLSFQKCFIAWANASGRQSLLHPTVNNFTKPPLQMHFLHFLPASFLQGLADHGCGRAHVCTGSPCAPLPVTNGASSHLKSHPGTLMGPALHRQDRAICSSSNHVHAHGLDESPQRVLHSPRQTGI